MMTKQEILLVIVGTRPELIKVAPIVIELEKRGLRRNCILVNTAQHKDLLEPYWNIFGIKPDIVLDVMIAGQSLSSLTTRAINQIQSLFLELDRIDWVLAQGDTTTVLATSIVCFYNKIKFIHLEAGLRTFDLENPFPEEFNRKIASIAATIHFAPTKTAKINLLKEGIKENDIVVVGNTVIDSLNMIKNSTKFSQPFNNDTLKSRLKVDSRKILVTCHRRENQGDNLLKIIESIKEIANIEPNCQIVWTLHPNPNINQVVKKSSLNNISNIILVEPLDYFDLLRLLSMCDLVITDSGGIQEESPSFKVPVIVLRETTERPEGLNLGLGQLTSIDELSIIKAFKYFWTKKTHFKTNPYGEGDSSVKIVDYLFSRTKRE